MQSSMSGVNITVVIPWVLTLATALIGIWQFAVQRTQSNRQPFLQKQLDLAFQASEVASRLATLTDPVEWEAARSKFWILYWGPLSLVEDPKVEAAMVQLGALIPSEPQSSPQLPMRLLEDPSYDLAHALRDLVLASWNVSLPPLKGHKAS